MCFVGTAHFACGHMRMTERTCAEALDVPFFIMLKCPNYRSESVRPQGNRKCGLGGFYCKSVPDGEYLDQICADYLTMRPELSYWETRAKEILRYQEVLDTNGIEALQASHPFPAPTKQLVHDQLSVADWNRAQISQSMKQLASVIISAKQYYVEYEQRQQDGTVAPAFVLGPKVLSRAPVELSLFFAKQAFPHQFASASASVTPLASTSTTQTIAASEYDPTTIYHQASEPRAPVLAEYATTALASPDKAESRVCHRRKEESAAYASKSPLMKSASTERKYEFIPANIVEFAELADETPSKILPRKRKPKDPVSQEQTMRRSSRVANQKINYAMDDDEDVEGFSQSSPYVNEELTKLIRSGARASRKSPSNKPFSPSPLRNSSTIMVNPSPLFKRSADDARRTTTGNRERVNEPSSIGMERKDSAMSSSQALNQRLQQASSNAPGESSGISANIPCHGNGSNTTSTDFSATVTPMAGNQGLSSPATVASSHDYAQLRRSFGSGVDFAPPSSSVLATSHSSAGMNSTEPRKVSTPSAPALAVEDGAAFTEGLTPPAPTTINHGAPVVNFTRLFAEGSAPFGESFTEEDSGEPSSELDWSMLDGGRSED